MTMILNGFEFLGSYTVDGDTLAISLTTGRRACPLMAAASQGSIP